MFKVHSETDVARPRVLFLLKNLYILSNFHIDRVITPRGAKHCRLFEILTFCWSFFRLSALQVRNYKVV